MFWVELAWRESGYGLGLKSEFWVVGFVPEAFEVFVVLLRLHPLSHWCAPC